mmetsp:Transcript_627/g.885  ORF Transcript_627/g.885 Transcript_627/m.885 type:complete len:82 (+) Transcript_627:918-1163(+)
MVVNRAANKAPDFQNIPFALSATEWTNPVNALQLFFLDWPERHRLEIQTYEDEVVEQRLEKKLPVEYSASESWASQWEESE